MLNSDMIMSEAIWRLWLCFAKLTLQKSITVMSHSDTL